MIKQIKSFIWKIFFVIFFLFALVFNSEYIQAETLDLISSVKIVLERNESVKIAKIELEKAKTSIAEAKGYFYPNLTANLSYTPWVEYPSAQIMNQFQSIDRQDRLRAGLTLQQEIFTFGRILGNLKQNHLKLQMSEENLNQISQEIILKTISAFNSALLAERKHETFLQQVELAKSHLQETELKRAQGIDTDYQVLRAQVQLSSAEADATDAAYSVEISKDHLALLLNLESSQDLQISGDFEIPSGSTAGNSGSTAGDLTEALEDLQEKAVKKRPELLLVKIQEENLISVKKVVSTNIKPNLSLIGNYNQVTDSLDDDFRDDWSLGLSLAIPIFEGFKTHSKMQAVSYEIEQSRLEQQNVARGIKLEVKEAYLSYLNALEQIKSRSDLVKETKESHRLAELRYKAGVTNNLEVLDAQFTLLKAELSLLQAKYQALENFYRLKKNTGELEDFFKF